MKVDISSVFPIWDRAYITRLHENKLSLLDLRCDLLGAAVNLFKSSALHTKLIHIALIDASVELARQQQYEESDVVRAGRVLGIRPNRHAMTSGSGRGRNAQTTLSATA